MSKTCRRLLAVISILHAAALPGLARAEETGVFQFLEEETKVVSTSRLPQSIRSAPATVYVVTAEEIKSSGAQTLWDILRTVPGVDVMTTRTGQGEVSIRGLNKALSDKTLVMVDGRTMVTDFFGYTIWESIQVSPEEIDRIEVVEGPVSALYGANAVAGVINIITKKPAQIKGGLLSYTQGLNVGGGEKNARFGTFLYGDQKGKLGYKLDLGWRSLNHFGGDHDQASAVRKANALLSYDFSPDTQLSLSAGISGVDTQVTTGLTGTTDQKGPVSYARTDFRHKDANLRFFWNRARLASKNFTAFSEPNVDYDTYDLTADRSLDLPFENSLVLGGNYRKNTMKSKIFSPGLLEQDIWGLFFENQWKPIDHWKLVASGRLDRHPYTDLIFSPRGSVIFAPVPQHVFRYSIGKSFRNPTMVENYLSFNTSSPATDPTLVFMGFTDVESLVNGRRNLTPEKMFQMEAAHTGDFGRVKTTLTGFHYRLKDQIVTSAVERDFATFPTLTTVSTFQNEGEVSALGAEFGANITVTRETALFANYSYESVKGKLSTLVSRNGGPRHKTNGGIRYKAKGVTASLWADWVDTTYWNVSPHGGTTSYEKLPDYTLINAHAGYEFTGKLQGLEIGLGVFNLSGFNHHEIMRRQSADFPGMSGEVVRARWTGTLAYHF
ncbi:MAG TPA: hypothetical protein DEB40_10245 [Elusimicrobia bacterium]|nr:hypothetical protein [Elusimicrobiota bacterium]HBT62109.1 hypothetical protein [Elusimicrobiota bacterium]